MTLALGFTCDDGLVIAADTEYSTDTAKRRGPKVWVHRFPHDALAPDLTVIVSGAGDVGWLHAASEHIRNAVEDYRRQGRRCGPDEVQGAVIGAATHVRDNDAQASLNLLVAVQDDRPHRRLIKTIGVAPSKVWDYQTEGSGSDLANYLLGQAYRKRLSVRAAVFLAAHVLRVAKQHVVGVGGPSDIAVIYNDGRAGFVDRGAIKSCEKRSRRIGRELHLALRQALNASEELGALAPPLITAASDSHRPARAVPLKAY